MEALTQAVQHSSLNGFNKRIDAPKFCPWCGTPTKVWREGGKLVFECGPAAPAQMCDEETFVTVTPQHSRTAGSCNACSRGVDGSGVIDQPVTQIDLRGCSVRVCNICLHDLVFKLQLRLTDVLRHDPSA